MTSSIPFTNSTIAYISSLFKACQYNTVYTKQYQIQADDPVYGHECEPWIADHQAAKNDTDNIYNQCKIIAEASRQQSKQPQM